MLVYSFRCWKGGISNPYSTICRVSYFLQQQKCHRVFKLSGDHRFLLQRNRSWSAYLCYIFRSSKLWMLLEQKNLQLPVKRLVFLNFLTDRSINDWRFKFINETFLKLMLFFVYSWQFFSSSAHLLNFKSSSHRLKWSHWITYWEWEERKC